MKKAKKTNVRMLRKINSFIKMKGSSKTIAKKWLKTNQPESMDEIPIEVFDLLHNRYHDQSDINTPFVETEALEM